MENHTRTKSGQATLRLTRRAVLLSAAALPLAGCWGSTYEWNQKIIVSVQTPAGERSGAAVSNLIVKDGPFFASASAVAYELQGEATVVEVAPGKYLFALLGDLDTKELASRAWPYQLPAEEGWARIEKKRESIILPPKLYPMLVTFDDINDPKTVKLVDPADLAATFGSGVALKSIALEITDEPETAGAVDKLLGWLGPHPEPPLCKPTSTKDYTFCAAVITHGNFKRKSQ